MASTRHEFTMEMTCEGCSGAAERVLHKLTGVTEVVTDLEKQTVVVTSSLDSEKLLAALKKTGKPVSYVGKA